MKQSFFALGILFLASTCFAWEGHSLLRRLALESLPGIAELPAVPVSEWTGEIPGINPATVIEWRGGSPGETQTPLDILVTYAQEPDWGMDQNLKASWQQRFMGGYTGLGSQGYFHMYYANMTLHLPVPVLAMGAAPRRAKQWLEMGQQAFTQGQDYWGWRFTAWALHYIEDLTQPFHSTQTHRKFVRLRSPVKGTTNCTANFHLLFEQWVAHRLADEASGGPNLGLSEALRTNLAVKFKKDMSKVVKKVARLSHKSFKKLAVDCIEYFGEDYRSSESVPARPEDLERVDQGELLEHILGACRKNFSLSGTAVRAVVKRVMSHKAR
jgi:hypothetical protein